MGRGVRSWMASYQTNLTSGGFDPNRAMGRGHRFSAPQQKTQPGEEDFEFGAYGDEPPAPPGQFGQNPFRPPNPNASGQQPRAPWFVGQSQSAGTGVRAAAPFPPRPSQPCFPTIGNDRGVPAVPPPPGFGDPSPTFGAASDVVHPKLEPQDQETDETEDQEAEADCGANEPQGEAEGNEGEEDGATAPKQARLSQSPSIADLKPQLSSSVGGSSANPTALSSSSSSSLPSFPTQAQAAQASEGPDSAYSEGAMSYDPLVNRTSMVDEHSGPPVPSLMDIKTNPMSRGRGASPFPEYIPLGPQGGFGARPPPPRPHFGSRPNMGSPSFPTAGPQRPNMGAPSFPSAGPYRPPRSGFNQRSRSPRPSNRWGSPYGFSGNRGNF